MIRQREESFELPGPIATTASCERLLVHYKKNLVVTKNKNQKYSEELLRRDLKLKGSVLARMRKMFPWLQIFTCGRFMTKTFKENYLISRRYPGCPTTIPLHRNGWGTGYFQRFEPSATGDIKIMLHHSHL